MKTTKRIIDAKSDPLCCEDCWLDNFSAFKNCSSQKEIISSKQLKTFDKGEYLVETGDNATGVFCIKEGMVKVSNKGNRNKEFTLWIAVPGDVVGLNSCINDELFSFSASAINQVNTCFIPSSDLKNLLNKEPMIFIQLMKKLCEKLNLIEQKITSISRKKIRERCAEVLVSAANQNNTGNNQDISINYSINDLACLIGTSKNYLYKILLEFTDKKILSVTNRKLIINNLSALSLIAAGNEK